MDIYRDLILDHYKHPRNFGHLTNPDIVIEEGNVTCGDRIIMEIKLRAQGTGGRVQDVMFSGQGCAISLASASLLTEKIKSMRLQQIMKLTTQDILKLLGAKLTPSRTKCAVLSLEVAQKAAKIGLQKK